MAVGWNTVQKIKRVEDMANKMGFEFSIGSNHYSDLGDAIHLVPLGDALPHYRRGADIYSGSIDDIDTWLTGLEWARTYDMMLRISSDKKRNECEQVERNRQLMKMVKTGKKVEGDIGFDITPYEIVNEDEVTEDDIPF
jgi:hypothetical protein